MRHDLDVEGIKDMVQIAMTILLFTFWQHIQSTVLATTTQFHEAETLPHNMKCAYINNVQWK